MNRKEWFHYGLLVLFVLVAYWPIASFHYPLRWDAPEQYFPWRYFLSDCLRHGTLPLWNPYPAGGYPFYADPQSGAWYPIAWLFGIIAPYTLQSMAVEFVATLIIGAFGMYRLVKSFELLPEAALIAAISYCTCGFFVSNAEHLTWIVSAAWIPWVFWAYHRMIITTKHGYALLCAVFLFLLLSGGYPAFIAITLYLIIIFFLVTFLTKRPMINGWKIARLHTVLAIAFLLIGGVVLLSWSQVFPYISRGGGLSITKVNSNPFSPQSLVSFLLPFATLKNPDFYQTDVSMRNAYFGLCTLLFLPLGLMQWKNRKGLLILLATLLCLAAAVGPYLPLRGWLYRFVPLMGMFRFPAIFRVFFLVGIFVLSAHSISRFQQTTIIRRWLQWATGLLLCVLLIVFCHSIGRHGFIWQWGYTYEYFKGHLTTSTHAEHVQLQCLLQIALLMVLFIATFLKKGRFLTMNLFIVFCCVDMLAATKLNTFGTIAETTSLKVARQPIANLSRDFRIPDNCRAVSSNNDFTRSLGVLRTNTSIFFKTPATDGYNPFILNSYNGLTESVIHDSVWANPYLYFSARFQTGLDTIPLDSRQSLRVDTFTYKFLHSSRFTLNANDSIQVLKFGPGIIVARVLTQDSVLLTLQQSYFKGWKILMDGKEQSPLLTNYAYATSIVPPGSHELVWRFNPPFIAVMAMISAGSLVLLVIIIGVFHRKLF